MPPTSPLRKKKDVIGAIKKFIELKKDSIWTISEIDKKFHPLKQLKINKKDLRYFHPKGKNIQYRQQLNNTYFRNGVAYVVSRKQLLKSNNLLSKNSSFYLIKSNQTSIDTMEDLILCRKYFN